MKEGLFFKIDISSREKIEESICKIGELFTIYNKFVGASVEDFDLLEKVVVHFKKLNLN